MGEGWRDRAARSARAAVGTLGFLVAPAAAAQTVAAVDAGATRVTYSEGLSVTALSVTPSLRRDSPSSTGWAVANLSMFDQAWSANGSGSFSVYTSPQRLIAAELLAMGGGSVHNDGGSTGQIRGGARVHLARRSAGVWAGGGLGTGSDGDSARAIRIGEAGVWTAFGRSVATVGLSATRLGTSLDYTTMDGSLWIPTGRLELTATAGTRSGDKPAALGAASTTWGNVGAILWIAQAVGLVASAGTYAPNYVEGHAAGTFVNVGVRVSNHRWRVPEATAPAAVPRERSGGGETGFLVVSAGGDRRLVRIYAPSARTVELAGDFTLWEPVPLTPSGNGWWTASVSLSPGWYEVNYRIDGGRWLIPPGLPVVSDPLGGASGRLLIDAR